MMFNIVNLSPKVSFWLQFAPKLSSSLTPSTENACVMHTMLRGKKGKQKFEPFSPSFSPFPNVRVLHISPNLMDEIATIASDFSSEQALTFGNGGVKDSRALTLVFSFLLLRTLACAWHMHFPLKKLAGRSTLGVKLTILKHHGIKRDFWQTFKEMKVYFTL